MAVSRAGLKKSYRFRRWISRRWPLIGAAFLILFVVFLVFMRVYAHPLLERLAQQRTREFLEGHFHGRVQFDDLQIAFTPKLQVAIKGLSVRQDDRAYIEPLVQAKRITFRTTITGLIDDRPRVSNVKIEGLVISTPPKMPGGPPMIHGTTQNLAEKVPVVLERIEADDALVVILRWDKKPPNQFRIHRLVLYNFRFDQPASFHATLTNPKPVGEIDCIGTFGPWEADQPSETPVWAKYTFRNADLGTLKGIKGILSSDGRFGGALDYLNVEGTTDTPDFALRTSDHPMPLHTDFTAVVDGTNGNTILKNVTATLANSAIVTHGEIVDEYPQQKGRTIALDATADDARIEDFLLLAVKNNPPVMTGNVRLKTKILIPEADSDVVDRLQLDGRFNLSSVHFSDSNIQQKIDTLSKKGQGNPKDASMENMPSKLLGRFVMKDAAIQFSDLQFGVEGAAIALGGNYNIDSGALDFRGKLRLDAKLSQTFTGWKSVVLKPFDGFFKGKNSGTEIPIKITGTRDQPSFGLDFHDKENKK